MSIGQLKAYVTSLTRGGWVPCAAILIAGVMGAAVQVRAARPPTTIIATDATTPAATLNNCITCSGFDGLYVSGKSCGETVDACIYIMIDRTGSMSAEGIMDERNAAKSLLNFLAGVNAPPPVAIGTFGCNGSGFPANGSGDLGYCTDNPDDACTLLSLSNTDAPAPYGDDDGSTSDGDHYSFVDFATSSMSSTGTHFACALDVVNSVLCHNNCPEGKKKILIYASDGGDTDPESSTQAAADQLKNVYNVEIFSILFPSAAGIVPSDISRMQLIASVPLSTHYYQAPTTPDLMTIFHTIANQLGCDDGNPCTSDTCSGGFCVYTPISSGTCDDGNPCTEDDTCTNGSCVGTPLSCNDGIACTTDSCTVDSSTLPPSAVCTHSPDHSVCPSDGNSCTDEICDPKQDCISINDDTNSCDDGLFCTEGDHCSSGACVGGPTNCDDGVNCTDDFCDDKAQECAHHCETPGIQCPGDKSCECDDGKCQFTLPDVMDDCSVNPQVDCNDVITPGPSPQVFTIHRTCTVTNDCGNSASCTHSISVVDTTPPIITCPPDKDCECGEPCDLGQPTVTDNCNPEPVVTYTEVQIPGDCTASFVVAGITPPPKLTVKRTYTASDGATLVVASGPPNTAQCVQTIQYFDTTKPAIGTCPSDFTIPAGGDVSYTPPSCTDLCGTCSVNCTRSDGQPLDAPAPPEGGPLTITCQANDECGNHSTCETSVTVTASSASTPTVSQWGMCVLTLLLLCAAKIRFARRNVKTYCS